MNIHWSFSNLLNNEFNLLDKKQDRFLLILICLLFSIFFLNVFVPFNINRWYSDSGFVQFLRLSSYGIVVAAALLFTQFPLRKLFKINSFKVKTFLLWLAVEILLISLTYIFLYGNPLGNFFNELVFSLKYTMLGIMLPYSLALLLIHYKNQSAREKSMYHQVKNPNFQHLIGLRDEKGKVRFSMLITDFLYLESADNYVYVYYLSDGKKQRKILRNSLKSLEKTLNVNSVLRCHRSFVVNTQNIEMLQKKGKKRYLKMKKTNVLIPVSQKYSNLFLGYIS